MKERAKQLADEHWDYISSLLATHGTDDTTMEIIGFHYNSAAIHFHGHGVEDERNRARATSAAAFENTAPITAYTEAAAMDTSTGYLAFAANAPKVVAGMADCANFDASVCLDCYHCGNYAQIPTPPAREPLDLRLPSYALPCTAKEAAEKYAEERTEWLVEKANTVQELVEMWDVLQAATTWEARSLCSSSREAVEEAEREIILRYEEGDEPLRRKLLGAKKDMLRKNAARSNRFGGVGYYAQSINRAIIDGTWKP